MAIHVPVMVATSGVRELARLTMVLGRLVGIGAKQAVRKTSRGVAKNFREWGRNISKEMQQQFAPTTRGMAKAIPWPKGLKPPGKAIPWPKGLKPPGKAIPWPKGLKPPPAVSFKEASRGAHWFRRVVNWVTPDELVSWLLGDPTWDEFMSPGKREGSPKGPGGGPAWTEAGGISKLPRNLRPTFDEFKKELAQAQKDLEDDVTHWIFHQMPVQK